jgi:hypothetical protein
MNRFETMKTNLLLTLTISLLSFMAHAGFSLPSGSTSPGDGISNVLSGSVANGALYFQSSTNWLNSGSPSKPYVLTNYYTLPVCDSISVARIMTTVWGATANYSDQMTVTVNGTNLPLANPLTFGTTADANAEFSPTAASVYGVGSGLWLVTLPVPPEMLFKDGSSNSIVINQTTPDSFDGRIHHVTFLAVYQNSTLANTFDYAIAEGSGDVFKSPSGTQVSQRNVAFAAVNPTNATAATITALYTYGDTGQNDRLYFNGVQYGSDDVAQWDKSIANYGPSIVSFDVLASLTNNNTLTFSVGSDVPATQETSLRPQLAVLAVTRAASLIPTLALAKNGQLTWLTNALGFALESSTNLVVGGWNPVTNQPAISSNQYLLNVNLTDSQRFYRLKK